MKTKLLICSFLMSSFMTFSQVMAEQVDDFEDGTTQNWIIGFPDGAGSPPANVPDGGPDGMGDSYLTYTSMPSISGAGSKMVIFNSGGSSQWTSNYISEGIVAIRMDVNVGINDLNLRVAFQGSGTRMCTTNAVSVPAGAGWSTIIIPITPSDFTVVQGSLEPADVLTNVQVMRILSNDTPDWGNGAAPINATLNIDNITASTTLSLDNVDEDDKAFTISPNPVTSRLNVFLPQSSSNATIAVYDVLGKRVYANEVDVLNTSINVANWNSGVYLIRVSSDNITQTKRFVKQ